MKKNFMDQFQNVQRKIKDWKKFTPVKAATTYRAKDLGARTGRAPTREVNSGPWKGLASEI